MDFNISILEPEVQKYINANLNEDLHSLLLKKSPFQNVSIQEICAQIKGRKVAEHKFPFLNSDSIIFPPQLNLEQASSQATSEYKSTLFKGQSLLDLTAGFGIDAYFLSKNFKKTTLVERNSELLKIVRHNWERLGKEGCFVNADLEEFLLENKNYFDVIYLDPARRDSNKNKVFLLEDLSPNILQIQNKLSKICDTIVIKLSPLIDLRYLVSHLANISVIRIIAVKNDVKEIIVEIKNSVKEQDIQIVCVNLESDDPEFSFTWGDPSNDEVEYSDPLTYLYIPNNSILKSGAFTKIGTTYGLKKLHKNTHLYTSLEKVDDFPGRILSVELINSKDLIKNSKYNIVSKNHPLKPEEIKKKYKLKDGGNDYLIFTQSISGKIILKSY